jgi:hypothetical protein
MCFYYVVDAWINQHVVVISIICMRACKISFCWFGHVTIGTKVVGYSTRPIGPAMQHE